ncbi:multimeric flavodoxin WrbA [Desulfosporosinus acidiphilus SJ4]|uniref:Multimeric flavodoxin WrbA n=1 Tax=Desulfosporosinus acidiphilus (strain DSM 22704 / JCM 16185 / SJ4) TaxID=646529 RepID=I4D550_DESAJ|nr:flavodoxin family protein [Desulfosporosinus acidiphilus]AFM40924.1 multimeric flavodoxin WrbA [Desulfosporosinus acidiphilus SJ4]
MNVVIFTCSPNLDGLTAACGKAAQEGALEVGANVKIINLNQQKIGRCQACGNGWGPCRNEHECQVQDEFQALHASLEGFDAFVFVTPVYFGDLSESAKAFTDRLRRCEAFKEESYFQGKPIIEVAAAGGTGNGITSCLTALERIFLTIKAEKFDLIGVTQKNRKYKLETIKAAAKEMVSLYSSKK